MDSTELVVERSLYIGIIISSILYGVQICLFFDSTYYMVKSPQGAREKWFYILYGALLLLLETFNTSANSLVGQLAWIEHRDIPGGPAAWFAENSALWIQTLGTASAVAADFMVNGLLLYRCYIIWSSRWTVILFPALMYLGSTSMAVIATIESALPAANLFHGQPLNFGVPWVALTVSLNIILTLMICTRLVLAQRMIRSVLPQEIVGTYTGVVALLIESATPINVFGIAFAVSYARNSPTVLLFTQLWGIGNALAPQLIVHRVATGRAWTRETASQVTGSIVFAQNRQTDSETALEFSASGAHKENSSSTSQVARSPIYNRNHAGSETALQFSSGGVNRESLSIHSSA